MGNVLSGIQTGGISALTPSFTGNIGSAIGNSVGGLTGGLSKGLTPQNEFQATSPLDINALNQQIAQSQQGLGTVQGNQSALAQALLAQSQGQGPNPVQAQLAQATNNNIAQNTGMIASQKGINPALAIRQASQNAANTSQQMAGQGAILNAQQQLNAQNALSNLYGQQANENLQNISTSGQLANQASLGSQGINAGTSAQNAAATQNTNSGILNSIGQGISALAAAHGGMIPGYADGGSVLGGAPFKTGNFSQSNASDQIAQQMLRNAGVQLYANGVSPLQISPAAGVASPGQLMAGGPMDVGGASSAGGASGLGDAISGAGPAMLAYKGGKIPPHFHAVAKIYHPHAFEEAKGTTELKAKGGKVPGKAKVSGDSPKNDIVKTMLSPGEMVIPRSVMQSENPAEEAKKFVAQKLKEKSKGSSSAYAQEDFKNALKAAISSRKGS